MEDSVGIGPECWWRGVWAWIWIAILPAKIYGMAWRKMLGLAESVRAGIRDMPWHAIIFVHQVHILKIT